MSGDHPIRGKNTDHDRPLDRITPSPGREQMFPQTNIAVPIVGHPRLRVSGILIDERRYGQGTRIAPNRERLRGDLRTLQRNQKPPEPFPACAHYVHMA